ncbi:MAG: Rieske (2Fe-2S) protein [Acidimicrobiales bacterium]
MPWVSAGVVPPSGSVVATTGDVEVAVFNHHGRLAAIANRCLHKGGSLADGLVRGGTVTCPEHWWRYRLDDGQRVGAPELRLACFPVEERDGEAWVELPDVVQRVVPRSIRDELLDHARTWRRS